MDVEDDPRAEPDQAAEELEREAQERALRDQAREGKVPDGTELKGRAKGMQDAQENK